MYLLAAFSLCIPINQLSRVFFTWNQNIIWKLTQNIYLDANSLVLQDILLIVNKKEIYLNHITNNKSSGDLEVVLITLFFETSVDKEYLIIDFR